MEPSEAIETGENALRAIVRLILDDKWQGHLSEQALKQAEQRQKDEPRVRPGALNTDDLLTFVDVGHLTALIRNRWSQFAPVFSNQDRTKVSFEAFNVYRRRVAHHRPLLPFEKDLLSGISGQIRNQVSIYQQDKNPTPGYFAQIDSAADSEGRPGRRQPYGPSPMPSVIRVGETLTFSATATDPRGRSMEWELHTGQYAMLANYGNSIRGKAVGDSVRLDWTPEPADFIAKINVMLVVRNNSGYHATEYQADDFVFWTYIFEPPYDS